jgi:hypothetical protein
MEPNKPKDNGIVPSIPTMEPYKHAGYSASAVVKPSYASEGRKRYSGSSKKHDDEWADCCSVCGCLRCSCTFCLLIFAVILILLGFTLIGVSAKLPSHCPTLCGSSSINSINSDSTVVDSANNTLDSTSESCAGTCSVATYKLLKYSGIGISCIGLFIVACVVLGMVCRAGKNGGRGSGCCFCC